MKFRDPFGILSDEEKAAVEGLLDRYKSHLTITQIAEGIQVTLANARGLYEDAMALLVSGRLARAMALLIATMEEVGKVSVLASMSRIPKDNQKLWADAWESFRSHQHKSTWAFVNTYPDEGRAHPEVMAIAVAQQYTLADVGERLRQYALYVDFHAREKRWLTPAEVSQLDVEKWHTRAESALARTEALAERGFFSERALEIQREVYSDFNSKRPRRKEAGRDDVERAIEQTPGLAVLYYRRLVQEGILSIDTDLEVGGVPLKDFLALANVDDALQ